MLQSRNRCAILASVPESAVPPALESEVLRILEAPASEHGARIEALCVAYPQHAEAVRAWIFAAHGIDESVRPASGASAPERLAHLRVWLQHPERRYAIGGEVGRGGMGAVFEVRDASLGRRLAMKVMRLEGNKDATPAEAVDPQVLERFLEEAQITGQLDHPGIVPVHELGVDGQGRAYFTMKLVRGRTADEVFESARAGRDGWNRTRALDVVVKVCDALAFAHAHGVIHRDLKPKNVMVGRFGEVYVMDWGLAKVLGHPDRRDLRPQPEASGSHSRVRTDRAREVESDPDSPLLTMDGAVVGTPCYMSPEQAEGRVEQLGPKSDVYAVGAMLYTLLTGWQPYLKPGAKVSPYTILRWVQEGPPKPVNDIDHDVPVELVAICDKAMARAPEARYADARELGDDLRAFLANRVVRAHRTGALVEARLWVRRNRALAWASLLALSLLFAGGVSSALLAWSSLGNAERARQAEQATARERDQVRALSDQQRQQLTQGSWAAFNQADRMLDMADESGDPFAVARNRREALLLLARALQFDSGNRVAWYRFGWEATAHGELFQLPVATHAGRFPVWGPDVGRLCLTVDGRPRFIDVQSGEVVGWIDTETQVRPAFSRDGTRALTGRVDEPDRWVVEAWDVGSRRLLAALPVTEQPRVLAFDGPGTRVLTAFAHSVQVWDVGSATLRCSIPQTDIVDDASFTRDDKGVIVNVYNGPDRVWDATTGELLASLEPLRGVVYAPEGGRLLHRPDHNAAVVRAPSGDLICSLPHAGGVSRADFSEDGLRVITLGGDGATVWDAITGDLVRNVHAAVDARMSPDGAWLATEDLGLDCVRIWDLGARQLEIASLSAQDVLFRSDGARLVAQDGSILDCSTGAWSVFVTAAVFGTAFHADGNARILTRWRGLRADPAADSVVDVRTLIDNSASTVRPRGGMRLAPSRLVCTLDHGEKITLCTISADATRVLTSTNGGTARIWDVATGQPVSILDGQPTLTDAFFCADGRRLVGCEARGLVVWDVATGKRLLERTTAQPQLGAISPDGGVLVTVDDGQARMWHLDSPAQPFTLEPMYPSGPADFSADDGVLTYGSGNLVVSDTATSRPRQRLKLDWVPLHAAFGWRDEQVIATSFDRAAVFDIRSRKTLCSIRAGGTRGARLGPDGTRLVTLGGAIGGRRSTNALWDLALPAGLYAASTASADADLAMQLAEMLTGQVMTAQGDLLDMPPEREPQVRSAVFALRDGSSQLTPLVRWLAVHGPDAPLAPTCSVTRRQHVAATLRNLPPFGGLPALYRLDPSDPVVLIGMAEAQVPGPGREFLCELGLQRLPPEVARWVDAAWMLLHLGDKHRALRAANRALELDPNDEDARRAREVAGS